tara:strand:- start:1952 stop:2422 length:471 start_codon:yes stop_codon:yes gene_type:complete
MILNKFGVGKTYTLEVQPLNSATQTTWQFPDIPFLREKYITGIALSTNTYGTTSGKANLGIQITSSATYSGFLTLVDNGGKQFIQNMPLDELICQSYQVNNEAISSNNTIYSYNTNGLVTFKPINIVWTKCYIYFPVATALSNYCCQFNVYYQDQK